MFKNKNPLKKANFPKRELFSRLSFISQLTFKEIKQMEIIFL